MLRQASAKVLDLIEPIVVGLGYEFVGAEYLPQGRHSLLRVYIDNPETGVSVDDCEKVSRQVSSMLDVEDPIPGHYSLEISSPGLDRPLFRPEHFQQFAGHEIKLRLSVPVNGRRKLSGKLMGIENGTVSIEVDDEIVQVAFDDLEKAHLIPVFD